jgi:hypothetical protein
VKLSDIIAQVNGDVEEDYDAGPIIGWVNRALDDLTPVARVEAQKTYTIDGTNSYLLPTDLHKPVIVLVNNIEWRELPLTDRLSTGYRGWGGNLSLQGSWIPDTGTIDYYYYRRLAHLSTTDMNAEPELEPEFHDLLIHFAAGMIQFTEEEYDRPDALQKYNQRKEAYTAYKNMRMPPARIRADYGMDTCLWL